MNWKHDQRPKRLGWAPGDYLCVCNYCADKFLGDKRAWMCADCAYAGDKPADTLASAE